MPFILGANSVSGYTVKNSLRFNSGSSDYLNRANSTPTGTTKWTFSTWLKRSVLSTRQQMFRVINPSSTSAYAYVEIDADQLGVAEVDGTNVIYRATTQVFRDVSAWYHIVVAIDTTQATASNRIKIYVNGSEITSFAYTIDGIQNQTVSATASGKNQYVGAGENTRFTGGYMSEIFFIDGQQLTPSSFGETDTATGIWKPKAYTGTYGTNGFYLKFANSASLGTDSSGNGNNFTVNNLTSVDQTTDTPTNNFATLNPVLASSSSGLTNGNTTYTNSSATYGTRLSTIATSIGKWYFEAKVVQMTDSFSMFGIQDITQFSASSFPSATSRGYAYRSDGLKGNNNTNSSFGNTYTTGDIIMIALDLDNNYIYAGKNGTWQNSGVPTSGSSGTGAMFSVTSGYDYCFAVENTDNTTDPIIDANFGNPQYSANSYTDGAGYGNFSYSVPSGYYSLCTKNLATYG